MCNFISYTFLAGRAQVLFCSLAVLDPRVGHTTDVYHSSNFVILKFYRKVYFSRYRGLSRPASVSSM